MFIHFYLNGLNAKDGNTFLNGPVTPLRHQVTKKPSKRPAVSEPLRVPRLTFLSGQSGKKPKNILFPFFVLSDEQAASPSSSHALMAAGSQNHSFFFN
jgi:hypothetical protein